MEATSLSSADTSESVMTGRVVALNVSGGGVPKRSVQTVDVAVDGIVGDKHRNRYHGGLDRALVIYSRELIDALRAEGHPIAIGTVGENITVEGLDWSVVRPGTLFAIGEVRAQVASYATPCKTIRHSFSDEDSNRIFQNEHPGWSRVCCRVLAEGRITVGDGVRLSR
jgi:MOSC domain-containing protein YiiM